MNTNYTSSSDPRSGCGPLEPYLADRQVSEILVDGPARIYVERDGQLEDVPEQFASADALMDCLRCLLAQGGYRLDDRNPIVEARLPDGARLHAILPPLSSPGPALTIRKYPAHILTLDDLLRFGSISQEIVDFIHGAILARLNILVAGGWSSGKTTVFNLIAGLIPPQERIIAVEHGSELYFPASFTHLVRLETRPPDAEGRGEVTSRDLFANALLMRPDRILIGEVQGGEMLDILRAMHTGYRGTMFTLHADGIRDALYRLEMMATMSHLALPLLTIRQIMASGLNLIMYQERLQDGTRKVMNVAEVQGLAGDTVLVQDVFQFRQTGWLEGRIQGYHTATGVVPHCISRIREAGIDLPMSMFTPK